MASLDDITARLALLYRIHGISAPSSDIERLLSEKRFDEAGAHADALLSSIQELLLSLELGGSNLYEPLQKRLTAEQYVLPREMKDIHPRILSDITSGKTTDHFPYGGLLLYDDDLGGTGKTEYCFFLAAEAKDKVRFVLANGNVIRESNRPGTVLKQLYQELEEKAVSEGVLYVVFIDEFEKLVNKYAKQHTHQREEYSDTHTGKTAYSQERRETTQTLEVDDKGEELFSTLKTLISGVEEITHVFTIAASNQSTYPETLLRRLEPVELHAFGIVEAYDHFRVKLIPDYGSFNESFPHIFPVLQATHTRLHGERNPFIERIETEVLMLLVELRVNYGSPSKKRIEHVIEQRNCAYLNVLLKYFGCPFSIAQSQDAAVQDILKFAGVDTFYDGKTSDEVMVMRKLTPDKVAKWYKSGQDAMKGYDSARFFIGQRLFPQLEVLKQYIETKT